ncbi:MAG: outer membrane protein assembly factor BamD [Planctomycetes bacterium]|nr:outer membrane protein assembly factor BamD [Planctomycetota bacterium]
MRWLRFLTLLGIVLAFVAVAEAKLVFRDGKWVRVPDEEEVTAPSDQQTEPAEPRPVITTPVQPTKQPQPAEQPAATPSEKPVERPVESPTTVPEVEPQQQPTVETPPVVTPAETPAVAPVETPVVKPSGDEALMPMRPVEPDAAATTEPAPEPAATATRPVETPVPEPAAQAESHPASETVVETPAAERPTEPATEPAATVEVPATTPPTDEQIGFEFRDGRWVPVVKPTVAEKPAPKPEPTEIVATTTPTEPEPSELITEPPLVTPVTKVKPEDHGPDLPPPVDVQPLPEPALAIAEVPSIGEKYRQPQPSQAGDEAEGLLQSASQADAAGLEAVRSMIARFKAGQYGATAKQASKFLKKNAVSPCAEPAAWLKAEAVFSGGDYYKAFEAYEHFINNYAGSRLVDKALVREMECAEALFGPARRKILGLGLGSGNDEAVGIMEKVYSHRPTGPLAADAIFRIGEFKMGSGKPEEAEEQFRRFLEEFPNHARARQARLMAAQSAMASCLGPVYDDASIRRARDMLQSYQDTYPEMAARENVAGAMEAIRRHQATKKYEMAAYYQRAQEPKAAAFYARKVVEEFPGTPAAVEARDMLQKLSPH